MTKDSDLKAGIDTFSADLLAHIDATLDDVAREHGIAILFAAESGSRAWGFASPDSDYDVRFIYAHPRQWYASIMEARDVVERPLDRHLVDLAGWDLRKALRLMLKSNPAFYEWLVSPIVYRDDHTFAAAARTLFESHAELDVMAHHYHAIARGQWKSEIESKEAVKLKKYFYVVRPLLSLAWIEAHGSLPPMSISDLLAASVIPADVRAVIDDLLHAKRQTPELGRGPRIATLDAWAINMLETLTPTQRARDEGRAQERLAAADALFRSAAGL